jgi:hypothetical protein
MILSCMLSEEYVEKQNTGLAMTDMYKNIENDAYNAVMIQAKKRSVSSVYSEITSYASKFTSEPGAFGDLARMVCGQNTNSGWATSQ